MLHLESVEPFALDILKKLLEIPALSTFYLVGGTALALKYGHRKSVDLDLFSNADFANEDVFAAIQAVFPQVTTHSLANPIGVFAYIDDLKVDLVRHVAFPMIEEPEEIEGIRFFADQDIGAMKVFAALKRVRKKDYFDLSLLANVIGVDGIVDSYFKKYPFGYLPISIPRMLLFFDDVEDDPDPIGLNGWTWEKVKKNLSQKVNEYLK